MSCSLDMRMLPNDFIRMNSPSLPLFRAALLMTFVGSETGQTSREKKVVVLSELHRAIIYTTEMSKQVTNSHVRDAVHMYPVN